MDGVGGEWVGRTWSGRVGWCYVCVSCDLDYLCGWLVQVSVYCDRRMPA